jgi:hypothetical protein
MADLYVSQNPKCDEQTHFLFPLSALMADGSLSLKDNISKIFLLLTSLLSIYRLSRQILTKHV